MDPSSNASPSRSPDPGRASRPSTELESPEILAPPSLPPVLPTPLAPSLEGLRSALEPEDASVARVLRAVRSARTAQATSTSSSPETRAPYRLIATLAATTAVAAGLILALPQWRGPAPESLASGRISISNQGEIVVARRPEESGGWIVRSGSAGSPSRSQIILVLHGD